jgi:hypothetical protein
MDSIVRWGLVGAVVTAIGLTACAADPSEEDGKAPELTLDAIDPADEGTSYNGWTQQPVIDNHYCLGFVAVGHILSRSSGDATRGGGACQVRRTATSCSSDALCLSNAQAQYGAAAWGYCYAGKCYTRPGAQSTYCVLNPNRAPGAVQFSASPSSLSPDGSDYAIGCMTKTAGPNTACGGTNTSLYMRTASAITYNESGCF